MTVEELISKLKEYNPKADINVVVHCTPYKFSLSYGSSEGCTPKSCDSVSLYVDELCTNEQ